MSPRLAMNLPRSRRLSLPVDTLLRWLVPDLRNLTLPLAVIFTRLSRPLCDFILGMAGFRGPGVCLVPRLIEPVIVAAAAGDAKGEQAVSH